MTRQQLNDLKTQFFRSAVIYWTFDALLYNFPWIIYRLLYHFLSFFLVLVSIAFRSVCFLPPSARLHLIHDVSVFPLKCRQGLLSVLRCFSFPKKKISRIVIFKKTLHFVAKILEKCRYLVYETRYKMCDLRVCVYVCVSAIDFAGRLFPPCCCFLCRSFLPPRHGLPGQQPQVETTFQSRPLLWKRTCERVSFRARMCERPWHSEFTATGVGTFSSRQLSLWILASPAVINARRLFIVDKRRRRRQPNLQPAGSEASGLVPHSLFQSGRSFH